jgi:integrase
MRTGEVLRYQGKRGTVWRLRYRDASGRRVRETLGREADGWNRRRSEAALRERLSDVDRGYRRGPALAFEAFARWWLDEYLPGRALKDSTLESYRTAVERHLVPALGGYAVAELEARPELIDGFVANAVRAGLAPKTVSNLVLVLRVMLKQAVRRGLLRTNPAAGVERPRPVEPDMQVLTDTEIARLWTAYGELEASAPADERPWWATVRRLVFVALGTALRRGELLALRWRDVELLEGRLHVRAALVRGRETTPKSRAGRRTLDLGSRTAALLQEHWQASAYRGDDEYVFCHPTKGTALDPSNLSSRYLRPALRRAGITKPFRVFHDLRHTALTLEAAAGNPAVYVQLKAGHSQAAITKRYIHAAQVLFPGAAQRGEDRLFGAVAELPGPDSRTSA